MKNSIMSFITGFSIILLLISSSCKEDVLQSTTDISVPEELLPLSGQFHDILECQKFNTDDALESEDYVIIEGDIVIAKEALYNLEENPLTEDQTSIDFLQALQNQQEGDSLMIEPRQYVINSGTLINLSDVDDITYYVDESIDDLPGNPEWYNAILNAMSDWANISDCKIDVEQVSSNSLADLSFYADNSCPVSCMNNLPSNVAAKAMFPQNNNVGRYISINNVSLSYNQKKWCIRHEIGHALGFRHNNGPGIGEPTNATTCGGTVNGLNLLVGTPTNDTYSVMRTPGPLTLVLSANDKEAARYMYPNSYTTPAINSHTVTYGNPLRTVKLNVNSSSVTPYQVVVTRYSTSSSTILQTNSFFDPYNDDTSFSVPCPVGTWRFKVWRKNFGGYSKISSYYTVVVQ